MSATLHYGQNIHTQARDEKRRTPWHVLFCTFYWSFLSAFFFWLIRPPLRYSWGDLRVLPVKLASLHSFTERLVARTSCSSSFFESFAERELEEPGKPYKILELLGREVFEFFYRSFFLNGNRFSESAVYETIKKAFMKKYGAPNRLEDPISVTVNARSDWEYFTKSLRSMHQITKKKTSSMLLTTDYSGDQCKKFQNYLGFCPTMECLCRVN